MATRTGSNTETTNSTNAIDLDVSVSCGLEFGQSHLLCRASNTFYQNDSIKPRKGIDMKTTLKLASCVIFGTLLSACVEDTGSATLSPTPSATLSPTPADRACLNAVAQSTGNSQVRLLSSEFSEAGTLVKVGVGPDAAPWECIAYSDGTTDGIMSLTNEGSL